MKKTDKLYIVSLGEDTILLKKICRNDNIIELADGYMAKNYPSKPYWFYMQNNDDRDSLIVTMFDINNIDTLLTKM